MLIFVFAFVFMQAEVSFVEVGSSQLPFPREMMSLRYWKRVKN